MKKMTRREFAFRSDLRCSDSSPFRKLKLARSNLRAFFLAKFVISKRADYSLG